MKSPAQIELENMALSAELSRQLNHDFSNFIHNLFLQIEIWKTSPTATTYDWGYIKNEGKEIIRHLREWEHFQGRYSREEGNFDLHQVIGQTAEEVSSQDRTLHLASSISAAPCFVSGSPLGTKHLLRLLVEDTLRAWEEAVGATAHISIETASADMKAIVRIVAQTQPGDVCSDAEFWDTNREEAMETSLVAAACRSLAVRLDAPIQRERADGRYVIQVTFPLTSDGDAAK